MEITTIKELISYVKLELVRQTEARKRVVIELDEVMFFKFIKLIQFCIRDKKSEPYRKIDARPNWKRFNVRINDRLVKVIRK